MLALALILVAGIVHPTAAGGLTLRAEDERKAAPADAQKDPDGPEALMGRAQIVVAKGLRYLASQQQNNGSFHFNVEAMHEVPIAITALAALAFMANGSSPERGPYAIQVDRAIKWLIDHCALTGPDALEIGEFRAENDSMSRMHGHGYATLALAEAYGMFGTSGDPARLKDRERLKRCLVAAIRYSEKAQTPSGGWGYELRTAMHEGSVTVTQLQGLRAAHEAGVHVNKHVIDAAVQYLRDCQNLDSNHPDYGGFRYMKNNPKVTFALTAAAVSALNATGDYDSAAIDRGIDYMSKKDPELLGVLDEVYREYARLYAGQALYQYRNPDRFWKRWYRDVVDLLTAQQQEEGWFPEQNFGPVYATAMNCLTLAIPFGYLPIFQR